MWNNTYLNILYPVGPHLPVSPCCVHIIFDTIPTRSLWIITHVIVSCCCINLHENWQCRRINQSEKTMQVRLAEVCFFSTLVALFDPGKQTHTRLCIFKFMFIYIHPWITIYDLFNTIRHEWTKRIRTHLATQKNNGLIYRSTFFFSWAPRPATPITAMAFARLVSVFSVARRFRRVGCRSFSDAAGTAPFLGPVFAVHF